MIHPLAIKAILVDMQTRIATINKNELVVDDSQLTKSLEALKVSENFLLLGMIPEYQLQGTQDSLKYNSQLMFMFLKKTNSKNTSPKELNDILQETLQAAKEFMEILLSEKSGDEGDFCGLANELNENSIRIYPIWNKSECNGWGLDIDLLSNV